MMLDGSLHELVSLGYREIDCKLYEAGMKLKYSSKRIIAKRSKQTRINISETTLRPRLKILSAKTFHV